MSKKISELPAATSVGGGDYIPIVQDGETMRATVDQLPSGGGGGGSGSAVSALSISSGVMNVDCSLGDYFTVTLSENVTSITFSNLPGSGIGASKLIRIQQHASAPKTVSWPASFKWENAVPNTVSADVGMIDMLSISSFDNGTTWLASIGKNWA